jgi:hypothetical protein
VALLRREAAVARPCDGALVVSLGGSSETTSETRYGYSASPTALRASLRSQKMRMRLILPSAKS